MSRKNYWEWKPWQTLDTWEGRKRPGRKPGSTTLSSGEVKLEIGNIVNYMTFWRSKIENKKNKENWVKPNIALTLTQACAEFWISPATYWSHMKKFPEAKELYQELKENRREYLKELSENNIQNGLAGELGLSGKEIVDASFKMLEKTDKAYQPKLEIEQKAVTVNLHKSTDDILAELNLVLWGKQ